MGKQPNRSQFLNSSTFHTSLINELSKSRLNRILSVMLCTTVEPTPETESPARPAVDIPLISIRSPSGRIVKKQFTSPLVVRKFERDSSKPALMPKAPFREVA